MSPRGDNITLAMIVKDERAIIDRCLESVWHLVDDVVIHDTGSTDGTREHLQNRLRTKGRLLRVVWQDFAVNRNAVLVEAASAADYILVMDADEVYEGPPLREAISTEVCACTFEHRFASGDLTWVRPKLIPAKGAGTSAGWHYAGAVHEAFMAPPGHGLVKAEGAFINHTDGARNRDPAKYLRDAELLERVFRQDPHDTRTAFYLAQSYRSAGRQEEAAEMYLKRAAMDGFFEERYCAHLYAGRIRQDPAQLLAAYNLIPDRLEALVTLAALYRGRAMWEAAWLFAHKAIMAQADPARRKDFILFVEGAAHTWRPLDEASLAAFYRGDPVWGRALCQDLLSLDTLPEEERPRIETNLRFMTVGSLDAKKDQQSAAVAWEE